LAESKEVSEESRGRWKKRTGRCTDRLVFVDLVRVGGRGEKGGGGGGKGPGGVVRRVWGGEGKVERVKSSRGVVHRQNKKRHRMWERSARRGPESLYSRTSKTSLTLLGA